MIALRALAILALAAGAALAQAPADDPLLARAGWRILPFGDKPPTRFAMVGPATIEVTAAGGAGFLVRPVGDDEGASRRLGWRWQVEAAPPPSDPARRGADDRPLAVHVFFAADPAAGLFDRIGRSLRARVAGAPFDGRLITYMWGGTAPAGTRLANPYLARDGAIVVLRDGGTALGEWRREQVDLAADYRAAFGAAAPAVRYLAVSADADDRGGASRARVADLAFVPAGGPHPP